MLRLVHEVPKLNQLGCEALQPTATPRIHEKKPLNALKGRNIGFFYLLLTFDKSIEELAHINSVYYVINFIRLLRT